MKTRAKVLLGVGAGVLVTATIIAVVIVNAHAAQAAGR